MPEAQNFLLKTFFEFDFNRDRISARFELDVLMNQLEPWSPLLDHLGNTRCWVLGKPWVFLVSIVVEPEHMPDDSLHVLTYCR